MHPLLSNNLTKFHPFSEIRIVRTYGDPTFVPKTPFGELFPISQLYLSVSQADMDADDKSYLINWFHRFLSFIFYVLGNRNFLRCLPHKSNFRFLICAIRAYSADLRVDIESRTRVRVIEPSRPLLFECLRNMPDGPLGRVFLHKKITFGHPTPSGEMESSCVSLECADSKLFVGCFLNKICPSFRRTSFSFIEGYLRR
ncbi:hypothetical protein AVEN_151229-1 [Araneus ventricosus]|uniref:Uncharacterized protein n=1 Tax=Araneus ventricosus TaxID=182803 RepID=A0A4Y2FWL6_ARAVE|nr:hypothetical protein AVEN_226336-1 [Araneus ventricosus]GBM45954.1 hypothetical protein AVEN_151229-1 [Araneus ventricosus]